MRGRKARALRKEQQSNNQRGGIMGNIYINGNIAAGAQIYNGAGCKMGGINMSDNDFSGGVYIDNDGGEIEGGIRQTGIRAKEVKISNRKGKISGGVEQSGITTIASLIREGEGLITSPDPVKAEKWYAKLIKSIPQKIADEVAKLVANGMGTAILPVIPAIIDLVKPLLGVG